MATITLKIDLPDEARDALRWLPVKLRQKLEQAAEGFGMNGLALYIKLMALLSMPRIPILLDPVEQDIMEELRLALEVGRQGKTLDLTLEQPGMTDRVARFRQWAESHARDTPLLTDEEISREVLYGDSRA